MPICFSSTSRQLKLTHTLKVANGILLCADPKFALIVCFKIAYLV
jgi:hypothetical protein